MQQQQWCLHCARKASLTCACCKVAYYCNKKCQTLDFKYHRYEAEVTHPHNTEFSRNNSRGDNGGMDVENDVASPRMFPDRKYYKVKKSFVTHATKIRKLREELESFSRESVASTTTTTNKRNGATREKVEMLNSMELLSVAIKEREEEEADSFRRLRRMADLFHSDVEDTVLMATIQLPYIRGKRELAEEFAVAVLKKDNKRLLAFYTDRDTLDEEYQRNVFHGLLLKDVTISDSEGHNFRSLSALFAEDEEDVALNRPFYLADAIQEMAFTRTGKKILKQATRYAEKQRTSDVDMDSDLPSVDHKRKVDESHEESGGPLKRRAKEEEEEERTMFMQFAGKDGIPETTRKTRSQKTEGEAKPEKKKEPVARATFKNKREQNVAMSKIDERAVEEEIKIAENSPSNDNARDKLVDLVLEHVGKDLDSRIDPDNTITENEIRIQKRWFENCRSYDKWPTLGKAMGSLAITGMFMIAFAYTYHWAAATYYPDVIDIHLQDANEKLVDIQNASEDFVQNVQGAAQDFLTPIQHASNKVVNRIMGSGLYRITSPNFIEELIAHESIPVEETAVSAILDRVIPNGGGTGSTLMTGEDGANMVMPRMASSALEGIVFTIRKVLGKMNPIGKGVDGGYSTSYQVWGQARDVIERYIINRNPDELREGMGMVNEFYNGGIEASAGIDMETIVNTMTESVRGIGEFIQYLEEQGTEHLELITYLKEELQKDLGVIAEASAKISARSAPIVTSTLQYFNGTRFLIGPHCSAVFTDMYFSGLGFGNGICRVAADALSFESETHELVSNLNDGGFAAFKEYLPFIGSSAVKSYIFMNTMSGLSRLAIIMTSCVGGSIRYGFRGVVSVWNVCSSVLAYAKKCTGLGRDEAPNEEVEETRRVSRAFLKEVDDELKNPNRSKEANILEATNKLQNSGYGLLAWLQWIWQGILGTPTWILDTMIDLPSTPVAQYVIDGLRFAAVRSGQLHFLSSAYTTLASISSFAVSWDLVGNLIAGGFTVATFGIQALAPVLACGVLYYAGVFLEKRCKGATWIKMLSIPVKMYYRALCFNPGTTICYTSAVLGFFSFAYMPTSFEGFTTIMNQLTLSFSSLDAHGIPDPDKAVKELFSFHRAVEIFHSLVEKFKIKFNTKDTERILALMNEWSRLRNWNTTNTMDNLLGGGTATLLLADK